MKITLAMICGREAAHIETCLRAFAPAFDELSLVLAIGNQDEDGTESIALKVCAELGKTAIVSRYVNGPGEPRTWPHVDSFAAARQQSFMQAVEAGADWVFWTDADDVVDPNTEIAELRQIVAEGGADSFAFPYDVVGTGKRPMRERIIRAELFRSGQAAWSGCIHENITGARAKAMQAPVWRHAPHESKPSSQGRNTRLLMHELDGSAINAFYLHQEFAIKRQWAEAKRWGAVALATPGLPDSFRYEIALNHVRQGPREEAETCAARAFTWFPECREALAFLALLRMEEGRFLDALAFTRRMVELPMPAPERLPWCYEAKWYQWAHQDLLARLLRLTNQGDPEHEEDMMRDFKPPIISLIHATRGRHNQAIAARERWLASASNPATVETIWCVDADDKESVSTAKQFRHVIVEPGGGCVRAWNAGAEKATGQIIVQLSDDWAPPFGWDEKIIAEIGDASKSVVLAISDGHRTDDLLCMAILTRARWEQQGREMFSAEYKSMYSDNEFSHRAWRDGVVIDARKRITFEHMHPAFGKGSMDKTYAESNTKERYDEGYEIFKRRNPDAIS